MIYIPFLFPDPKHLGFLPAKQTTAEEDRNVRRLEPNFQTIEGDEDMMSKKLKEVEALESIYLEHVGDNSEVEVKQEMNEPAPAKNKVRYVTLMIYTAEKVIKNNVSIAFKCIGLHIEKA